MLLRRRKRSSPQNGTLPPLEQLRREIATLTEAELAEPNAGRERRLLALRHLAGIHLLGASNGAQFAQPDARGLAPGDPLPEFRRADLTPGVLRAGILRDGCVLVRQLVPRTEAVALAAGVERAYEERERRDAGGPYDDSLISEFSPRPPFRDAEERPWVKVGGGLLAADSPRVNFEMMRLFTDARLPELVSVYLGEPAVISLQKTTLRKAEPSVKGAWHQDGFFLGKVRSLNLWLSLSRCGDEAPGLDLVPRRIDHVLPAGTNEAAFTVSKEQVEQVAVDTPVIRPIFEPGDALFFDELFLHQTGSDPAMPNPRFAIENWFFGGSGFPADYAPIAV
jgi:hypothetical protein